MKLGTDVVHGCQLKCVGCPNATMDRPVKCMSVGDFETILQNIPRKVDTLRLFNFGEPFLHPCLPRMLGCIPKSGVRFRRIELATNAQKRDKPQLAAVIGAKVLTHLFVSCDGDGTKKEYEKLRPPAKWDQLMWFLDTAREIRDDLDPGLKLVTTTICDSREGRKRWKRLLRERGWTPEFRVMGVRPGSPFAKTHKTKCALGACKYVTGPNMYVDYNGDVVPCCIHPKAFVMGNMLNQTYKEVRRSAARREAILAMKKDRAGMEICGKCRKE